MIRWKEVDACIDEIEWYASRKKDLAAAIDRPTSDCHTWADMLMSDLSDLRQALREERKMATANPSDVGK